jgi:anti-sigma factor ChrR (cupin superfamily)
MATAADRHIDEETTEKYAMGKLSARAAALIEEHLLICGRCRQSLAASDAYIAAMGLAAAKLRRSERKPMRRAAR